MIGIWQLTIIVISIMLMLSCLVFMVIVMIKLINFECSSTNKVLWALLIILVPVIGPVSFLFWRMNRKKN